MSPSVHDLSVNTSVRSLSCLKSSRDASLLSAMCVLNRECMPGLMACGRTVLMCSGCTPNMWMSLCNAEQCLFMSFFSIFLMYGLRGWAAGRLDTANISQCFMAKHCKKRDTLLFTIILFNKKHKNHMASFCHFLCQNII